ncbi:MAG: flagellar hook-basal body complex protein FliE [Desulfobacterales bacterium GWB2_56_26]|nr:MAG: flagellar hook-basal body complex protein FliE [Desulfobacterales bacterium GWB2_56_26]HBG20921.1 flagellar hook-basal body complex protein FliE [Desulfobulbaceae bacterium]
MTTINSLEGITPLTLKPAGESSVQSTGADFGNMLKSMVEKVNNAQLTGEQAIQKLHSGKATHLHEVMIATEEADISLRMLVQLRNKAQTAYEEIMRMQI